MRELLLKRRVRKLIQEAERLLFSDSAERGRPIAEEAYQLSLQGLPHESAEHVLSAFLAGSARFDAKDLVGAERALTDAAQYAEAALQDNPERLAAVFNNLAIIYFRTKRAKKSLPLMERAIEIKRRLYGAGDVRYIENLQDLVAAFEEAGEPGKAEPYLREMAAIVEKHAGPKSADYAHMLENLALACRHNGKHGEAEEILKRVAAIRGPRSEASEPDPEMDALVAAAKQKYASGDFREARRIHREILDRTPTLPLLGLINTTMGNMFDPLRDYSGEVEKLGLAAEEQGRYDDAARAYRQRVEMFQVMFPEKHPWIAFAMSNEAEALRKAKRFDEAKPIILEAVSRLGGAKIQERETLLHNVAHLYLDICNHRAPAPGDDFGEATAEMRNRPADYERSMRIRFPLPVEGETPIQRALRLIDARARFYESVGDPARTQFLLETAVELARTVEPESAGDPMNELERFYLDNGLVQEASGLAEVIREMTSRGAKSIEETVNEMMRRAIVLSHAADHVAAEKLLLAALDLVRGTWGPDSEQALQVEETLLVVRHRIGRQELKEDVARIVAHYRKADFKDDEHLQHLANYHMELGEYAEAEECFQRTLTSQKEKEGEWNPHYALTLSNLGTLYRFTGRYGEAESLYRRAVEIRKVEFGPHHPSVIDGLLRLTLTLAALSKFREACDALREVMAASDRWLARVSGIASEAARLNAIREQVRQVDLLLSIQSVAPEQATTREAFEWVLKRKGLSLTALAGMRGAVLGGRYPKLRKQLAELDALNSDLARRALEEPGSEPDEEALTAREEMERELARSIPEMQLEQVMAGATVESVASALPAGSVLVEFLEYYPYNFPWVHAKGDLEHFPQRYVAFVLHAGAPDSLRSVDLGEAGALARPIQELVRKTAGETRALGPAPAEIASASGAARTLSARLLTPLMPMFGDAGQLLLAADGKLCLVPFEILPLENGELLLDRCEVSYLGTGRDALRFRAAEQRELSTPVIVADPDFDLALPAEAVDGGPKAKELRVGIVRGFAAGESRFGPLPGTRMEADRVSAILRTAVVYRGSAALEARIRQLRAPAALHLATHGFFVGADDREKEPDTLSAMYSSGLALAGANAFLAGRARPAEAEDGILTAEDVATLDLLDTELVVLSACNTATGELVRGEGVFGLRRAFFAAGARTVVMSLWQVPDLETAELMTEFYSCIAAGMPKSAALRKAKQSRRNAGAPTSAWAAFICEGDWEACRARSIVAL